MGDFVLTFFDNYEIAPTADRSPNYQFCEKKKFMIKRGADDEEDITFTLKNRDYRGREVAIHVDVDGEYSMEFMLSANKTIVIRGDEIFTHSKGRRRGMSEIKFWAFTD